MCVRSILASLAFIMVALPVCFLSFDRAAFAFEVPWVLSSPGFTKINSKLPPIGTERLERSASSLLAASQSIQVIRQNSLAAATAAVTTPWSSPSFGKVFSSRSRAVSSKEHRAFSALGVPLSANLDKATEKGLLKLASLSFKSDRSLANRLVTQRKRIGVPAETMALALLFSAKPKVSDKELASMLQGVEPQAPLFADTGSASHCGPTDYCTLATAPVPGAVWLIASALLGMIAIGYRRRSASVLPA